MTSQKHGTRARVSGRVQVLSEEYLIRKTVACFHLVTHAAIEALGSIPEALAKVTPTLQ